jgi:hypothetical protein
MAEKVLIYRPLGEHPPGTKMGELLLGAVHSVTVDQAATYTLKGFVMVPPEARTAKPDDLASMYALAKAAADADAEAQRVAGDPLAGALTPILAERLPSDGRAPNNVQTYYTDTHNELLDEKE